MAKELRRSRSLPSEERPSVRKPSMEFTASLQAQAAAARAKYNANVRAKFGLFPVSTQTANKSEENDRRDTIVDTGPQDDSPKSRVTRSRSKSVAPSYADWDPYSERVADWNLTNRPRPSKPSRGPNVPLPPTPPLPPNVSRNPSTQPSNRPNARPTIKPPRQTHRNRGPSPVYRPRILVATESKPPIPRRSSKRLQHQNQSTYIQRYSLGHSLGLTVPEPHQPHNHSADDHHHNHYGKNHFNSPSSSRKTAGSTSPASSFGTIRIVSTETFPPKPPSSLFTSSSSPSSTPSPAPSPPPQSSPQPLLPQEIHHHHIFHSPTLPVALTIPPLPSPSPCSPSSTRTVFFKPKPSFPCSSFSSSSSSASSLSLPNSPETTIAAPISVCPSTALPPVVKPHPDSTPQSSYQVVGATVRKLFLSSNGNSSKEKLKSKPKAVRKAFSAPKLVHSKPEAAVEDERTPRVTQQPNDSPEASRAVRSRTPRKMTLDPESARFRTSGWWVRQQVRKFEDCHQQHCHHDHHRHHDRHLWDDHDRDRDEESRGDALVLHVAAPLSSSAATGGYIPEFTFDWEDLMP